MLYLIDVSQGVKIEGCRERHDTCPGGGSIDGYPVHT